MDFKDIIQNAVNIGSESKFIVQIGDDEPTELNYIQLGMYLVSNAQDIESVKIIMRGD